MSDGANEGYETELISLADAAKLYGFNQRYLSELARKGRLKAQKLGDIWVTTKQDVETYIKSRKKTGVFREDIDID